MFCRLDFFERDKNSGGRLATQLKILDSLGWVLRAATVLYWLTSSFVERVLWISLWHWWWSSTVSSCRPPLRIGRLQNGQTGFVIYSISFSSCIWVPFRVDGWATRITKKSRMEKKQRETTVVLIHWQTLTTSLKFINKFSKSPNLHNIKLGLFGSLFSIFLPSFL